MAERLDFKFQVPAPPTGPVVELTLEESQKLLLQKLAEAREDPVPALWQLAHFYKIAKQREKALERLRQLMQLLPDPEQKAECVLTMGQAMEQVGDYVAAVRYYKEALGLEPTKTFTWYFINNNLGFSLNTLGQFTEGEVYCRKAIEIDPNRPNGYKNLGLSLVGQRQHREAAEAFVKSTQANAADARALRHLQDLLKQHPELEYEFGEAAEFCQKAVEVAEAKRLELKPVVYRGWRKQWMLLRMRVEAWFRSVRGWLGILSQRREGAKAQRRESKKSG